MRRLDSMLVLQAWESAAGRRPVAKALAVLAAACPDWTAPELAALPVGRRDGLLLDLYAVTFGPRLSGIAGCAECREVLEVDVAVETVRCSPPDGDDATTWAVYRHGDDELMFRCPDSHDLAAAADGDDGEDAARTRLLDRTVRAMRHGQPVVLDDVDPQALAAVVDAMAARDPQADIVLSLVCPACEATTVVLLDVAALVWQRVETWAQQVIADVDVLARAYGWEERAVLSLSEPRRQAYLQLAR